jgi:uncharacterized protein (DUF433 family)
MRPLSYTVQMDFWKDCEVVERIPGKCGRRPVIKGTRIEPDTVLADYELGSSVEEIHENFPTVPADMIRRLIAFALAHQATP